jgi:hypothetical protein
MERFVLPRRREAVASGSGGGATWANRKEPRMEERTEQQIAVRQVTHMQASWTEQGRGAPGAFTLQLILDNGAQEYVLRPTADDVDVLLSAISEGIV